MNYGIAGELALKHEDITWVWRQTCNPPFGRRVAEVLEFKLMLDLPHGKFRGNLGYMGACLKQIDTS